METQSCVSVVTITMVLNVVCSIGIVATALTTLAPARVHAFLIRRRAQRRRLFGRGLRGRNPSPHTCSKKKKWGILSDENIRDIAPVRPWPCVLFLRVGGNYNNGTKCGLFYWNCNNNSNNTNTNTGSRLTCLGLLTSFWLAEKPKPLAI